MKTTFKTLAILISTVAMAPAAMATSTIAVIDQHGAITSGPVDGNDHSAADKLTIQGDDNKTYDLENIGKNTADIANNATQIQDNKTHTDAWIVSVAAGAAKKTELDNEVNRATSEDTKQASQISAHETELGDHENRLVDMKYDVDHNKQDITVNKADIATNKADIQTNVDEINKVKSNVGQDHADIVTASRGVVANHTAIVAEQTAINGLSARADDTDTRIAETRAEQQKTNQRVAQNTADIANHEQRITSLESSTNSKFAELNKQMDDNRQRASAAISGVAAMANIPQVTDKQEFSVGAGVGTTDGESALAVGFSARATEHVVVKASVSNDTQQNFVLGGGVSYGW